MFSEDTRQTITGSFKMWKEVFYKARTQQRKGRACKLQTVSRRVLVRAALGLLQVLKRLYYSKVV